MDFSVKNWWLALIARRAFNLLVNLLIETLQGTRRARVQLEKIGMLFQRFFGAFSIQQIFVKENEK